MIYIILTSLLSSLPAFGQDDSDQEPNTDLIHSDVPLWGYEDEGVWPQHFSDDSGFGCSHRIAMGDWKVSYSDRDPQWKRFRNYGVFHCFSMISHAYEKADLDNEIKYGFFVKIGTIKVDGVTKELWVTQEGGRPGSDYQLLSRTDDGGIVKNSIYCRLFVRAKTDEKDRSWIRSQHATAQ